MASAGVRGGPGVRGVSLVASETKEVGVSGAAWAGTGGTICDGILRVSDNRFGFARFILSTGSNLVGEVNTPLLSGELEGGESFMVMVEKS